MRLSMRNRRRNLERLARDVPRGLRSNSDVLEVAQKLWSSLDTPLSLGLSILCKNGQIQDALRVDFDPKRYLEDGWELARDDYQAIAFLRKMPLLLEGIDRENSAWDKFLQAEERCRRTNSRIRNHVDRGSFPPRVGAAIGLAQHKISKWLGTLSAKSWALRCRFGPGADVSNRGIRVSAYHKLSQMSCTYDFEDGAQALIKSHPVWHRTLLGSDPEDISLWTAEQFELNDAAHRGILSFVSGPLEDVKLERVAGNQVTFVPKTALIDRSIAIEPGMNIFAQLGLGSLIRSRLKKRAGLNLDSQEPNQLLAYLGSKNGTVATIDLSSASDTIARELVRLLLPDSWFTPLDWCRSKSGTYRNRSGVETSIRYEKFSSMGNGFTFELESMIFYALAEACVELCGQSKLYCRAYGDDITVPTSVVPLLAEVLDFCGFEVNTQKSFSSGVFRESCGADFFNGKNVRPYFHKEFCKDARSLFRLANGLRRAAYRRNLGFGCDRKLKPVWMAVVRRIPDSLRDLRVPGRHPPALIKAWADVESGDGGLMSNLDESLSSPWIRFNRDLQAGWLFAELRARPRTIEASNWPELYRYGLYSGRDGSTSESTTLSRVVVRGDSGSILNPGAYAPGWLELGPWA